MPDIPSDFNTSWPNPTESSCAWYEPPPGYFNLNPEHFGLSFAIFDIYGQPVCDLAPPAAGWSDWSDTGKPPRRYRPRRMTNNPLAALLRRQSLAVGPEECYAVFNGASVVGQQAGYVYDRLCAAGTAFQNAITDCQSCARENASGSSGVESFPELQEYQNWCEDHAP